jgi:hypothetical protein
MPDYRCPIDDLVFESSTDHRKPGAAKSADGKFLAHPRDGHPDCPKCQERMKAAKTPVAHPYGKVIPRGQATANRTIR